jgi:hypothetical protein
MLQQMNFSARCRRDGPTGWNAMQKGKRSGVFSSCVSDLYARLFYGVPAGEPIVGVVILGVQSFIAIT